ncbi:hypothetical protein MD484_g8315, partial [Candolleomyces efflorescens]
MLYPTSTLFIPLLLASYVAAHGFLYSVTIGDNTFVGNLPSDDRGNRTTIIRQVRTEDPVKGARNPNISCGAGAFIASDVADANPGDTLTFDWRTTASLSPWPHNTGPIITYLAYCGNATCPESSSTEAKWFKIHQVGKKANGEWAQADLTRGGKVSVRLPGNILAGNYLVRHEIIALHRAHIHEGTEFHPSCTQIRIGGSGTGVPCEDELVEFPGAYSDDDAGIFLRLRYFPTTSWYPG